MHLTKITTIFKNGSGKRLFNIGEFNSSGELRVGDALSADRQRFESRWSFRDLLRMAQRKEKNVKNKNAHKNIIDAENGVVDILV